MTLLLKLAALSCLLTATWIISHKTMEGREIPGSTTAGFQVNRIQAAQAEPSISFDSGIDSITVMDGTELALQQGNNDYASRQN